MFEESVIVNYFYIKTFESFCNVTMYRGSFKTVVDYLKTKKKTIQAFITTTYLNNLELSMNIQCTLFIMTIQL
jgi:hypothetical protein